MMGVKHGKIQNHTFMPGPYHGRRDEYLMKTRQFMMTHGIIVPENDS